MAPEIPLQDSEDSVKLIRPRYHEGQDGVAQCASFLRKCEQCGLGQGSIEKMAIKGPKIIHLEILNRLLHL